jgi:hypothetical protein
MSLGVWNPALHEELDSQHWDEGKVRSWLQSLLEDTVATYRKLGGWPLHSRDRDDEDPSFQAQSLYCGSSGVIWGLKRIETVLGITLPPDLREAAYRVYVANPDVEMPGLIVSRGGMDLLAYAFGFDEAREGLTASIHACGQLREPREIFWGPPAALLLAYHAFKIRPDAHWQDLFRFYAIDFLARFGLEKHENWVWPQLLYEEIRPCIGAAHGVLGAFLPYMLGYELLPGSVQKHVFDQLLAFVQDTALETDRHANWAKRIHVETGSPEYLVQWCHGAPGIVSCLSYLPPMLRAGLLGLLCKAGQTIWDAGPLIKPAGLCHGNAGNAYAFLRLLAITGDSHWLDRARRFAMHAIKQSNTERLQKSQRYYSLLTGDVGLAVFLVECLVAGPGHFPVLESFAFTR